MGSVPSRDTRPESAVRKQLWSLGFRYRIHPAGVFGRPDFVFVGLRVAVFVDGDFWHGNPREWRRRGCQRLEDLFPTRTEWWAAKIRRNVERDRAVNRELRTARLARCELLGERGHTLSPPAALRGVAGMDRKGGTLRSESLAGFDQSTQWLHGRAVILAAMLRLATATDRSLRLRRYFEAGLGVESISATGIEVSPCDKASCDASTSWAASDTCPSPAPTLRLRSRASTTRPARAPRRSLAANGHVGGGGSLSTDTPW